MKTIFNPVIKILQKKHGIEPFEKIIRRAFLVMEDDAISKLKTFINSTFTETGAFADRNGKPDIYYSLFGFFIAKSFESEDIIEKMKKFITPTDTFTGKKVELFCNVILKSCLYKNIEIPNLIAKVKKELDKITESDFEYTVFMGLMALYYANENWYIYKFSKKFKKSIFNEITNKPCPVTAAMAIISKISGGETEGLQNRLMKFYNQDGGFFALKAAPAPDLLSTAVALYALRFIGADIIDIKPDCLSFVGSLFIDGGFSSGLDDFTTDIEYTFYGLLALGVLSKE